MAVANRAAKIFLLAGCLCSSLISILWTCQGLTPRPTFLRTTHQRI